MKELAATLPGCSVNKVYQLGREHLLFSLSRPGFKHHLMLGGGKRVSAHLLFEPVHREWLVRSNPALLMHRHVQRSRVDKVWLSEATTGIRFHLRHPGVGSLYLDAVDREGVRLFDSEGRVLCSFFRELHGGSGSPKTAGSSEFRAVPHIEPDEALPANRELSRTFAQGYSERIRGAVLKVLRAEEKKVSRLLGKLSGEQQELEQRETLRKKGELLKVNLGTVPGNARQVLLPDYQGGKVEVDLDPALSPQENMQRYFNRYKKLKRKSDVFEQKLAFEQNRLRSVAAAMESALHTPLLDLSHPPSSFIETLDQRFFDRKLRARLADALPGPHAGTGSAGPGGLGHGGGAARAGGPGRRKSGGEPERRYLRFTARSGKDILVGRSAADNDHLTVRVARGNDLWFHLEQGGGSHVVLRYRKGEEFLDTDIQDAGILALYFSRARSSGEGTVVYTRRKYVRKPKGAKPGYVIYHNHKSREVRLDQELLDQLVEPSQLG